MRRSWDPELIVPLCMSTTLPFGPCSVPVTRSIATYPPDPAAVTAKAKAIITKAREATTALDRQTADFREKNTGITNKRNADLKALLTADADKTKFDENAAAAGRCRRGAGL